MEDIKLQNERLKKEFLNQNENEKTSLEDSLSIDEKNKIKALVRKP